MIKIRDTDPKAIMVGDAPAKAIYRGEQLVWMSSELPVGYKRCVYLSSDSNQYIATGIIPTKNMVSLVTFNYYYISTYQGVFGSFITDGRYQIFGTSENVTYGIGNGYYGISKDTNVHTAILDADNLNVIVDGLSREPTNGTYSKGIPNVMMTLFATNQSGIIRGSHCKIYGVSIFDGTTPVANYVPCLDVSDRPCMYDTVTKTTKYNDGTGEFSYELQ